MNAYILVMSDKGSQGLRVDTAGEEVGNILKQQGYEIIGKKIIPDEKELIKKELLNCVEQKINLVFTVGGTGFSKRDVTPEATLEVIKKATPGLNEMMRLQSLKITPKAMLSRAVSGIKEDTLIVNLPGSKKAAKENLEFLLPLLDHGLKIMLGEEGECGN